MTTTKRVEIQIRQQLTEAFDEGELRTLCFDLDLDYESLPGEGKANKARELVAWARRSGQLDALVGQARLTRPHLVWPSPRSRATGTLIVVNLAHPLTLAHVERIEQLAGLRVREERGQMGQFDLSGDMAAQVSELVDGVGLTPDQWQGEPIIVNPPGYHYAAGLLMAELHGRMGHFPTIVRLRPISGATPTQFEVAELLNLQAVRDAARKRR